MKDIGAVSNFLDLHQILQDYRESSWYFRGQSQSGWKLVPKAARGEFINVDDNELFDLWKAWAYQYFSNKQHTDLQYLAIGQHHGLATRLLDWSENPLIATYFAVTDNLGSDAEIFILCPADDDDFIDANQKIWGLDGIKFFHPGSIGDRLISQWGLFSVHSPKDLDAQDHYSSEELHRILIKKECKNDIRKGLYQYGIGAEAIFPGLDGWSIDANWQLTSNF